MHDDTKPPLEGLYLEHFGVKGMKWGSRKSGSSKTSAEKSRTRKKVVAGVAVAAVGAAAVAYALRGRGNISVPKGSAASAAGRARVNDISQSEWKKRVADLRSDIRSANADQDRWMRKQGLGAALNAKGGSAYNTKVKMGDLSDVRRALNDPNHVWEL